MDIFVFFLITAAVSIFALKIKPQKLSQFGTIFAVAPPVIFLIIFYLLAAHMYHTLGGWPKIIGEQGFPKTLTSHAYIAMYYFVALTWGAFFIWPIAFIICLIYKKYRSALFYLSLNSIANLVCLISMFILPSEFLTWWWD